MSTLPTIDSGTLGWVKSEIEDTAAQAHDALDAYARDSGDQSAIRMCATHLHQVHGTLSMVELDGVARLVQESESLVLKLSDGAVSWNDSIHAALKKSIQDVSNYLEALQSPPVPSPLQLVPAINQVRDVQQQEAISEFELFTPDLSARPPDATMRAKLGSEMFLALVGDLRARFERSLLVWLRDSEDRNALSEFGRVFSNLVGIERRVSLRQLWWTAAALCEAMLDGSHKASDETRLIFARLNEQLKFIKEKNQSGNRRTPPDELIKRILLLLAYCKGTGRLVNAVREGFHLEAWVLPGNDHGLPDVENLTKSLINFLHEANSELDSAQNLLARYFSPQGQSPDVLSRLDSRLSALRVAAKRNELEIIEALLDTLIDISAVLKRGQVADMDRVSLQMAGALLFIQDSVSGQIRPGVEWRNQADASIQSLRALAGAGDSANAGEGEFVVLSPVSGHSDSMRAAAAEVRGELQYVEHNLDRVANREAQVSTLRSIDGHLKRVEGTLEILEQTDGALLAEKLRGFVAQAADEGLDPDPRALDAMAMAVGTLAAVADSLEQSGEITTLGSAVDRAIMELDSDTPQPGFIEPTTSAPSLDDLDLDLDSEIANFTPTEEPDDDLDAVLSGLGGLSLDNAAGDEPLEIKPFVDEPAVDEQDEFVAMFFEEARELGEELLQHRSTLATNPGDADALQNMRRCFHTLKGSSRFVEAVAVSELAWSVEELLNHIIDSDASVSPAVLGFVDQAWAELDGFITTAKPDLPADISTLQARAKALIEAPDQAVGADQAAIPLAIDEPIAPDLPPPLPEIESFELAPAVDEPLEFSVPEPDFQLDLSAGVDFASVSRPEDDVSSIFRNEMEGYIDVIAQSVAEARQSMGDWAISDDLLRVSHTLKGVLGSVGLNSMAQMADALDSLFVFRHEQGARVEEVDLVLLDQSGRLMRFAMGKLDDENRLPLDLAIQFDELGVALTERLRFLRGDRQPVRSAQPELQIEFAEQEVSQTPQGAPAYDPVVEDDDELLGAFKEETQEILERFDQSVQLIESEGVSSAVLSALRRELHTFKGGARAVGWSILGDLGHNTETLLENESLVQSSGTSLVALLQEFRDLSSVVASTSQQLMATDIEKLNNKVLAFGGLELTKGDSSQPASTTALDFDLSKSTTTTTVIPAATVDTETRLVRVSTEVLDELVNYAGEVSILRSRLQQQISMVKNNLIELNENVRLFRDQLRDLEIEAESQMLANHERMREESDAFDFDPLEMDRFSRLQTLARGLSDNLNDLVAIQAGLSEFSSDAENTLQQQSHISDGLQEGLLRTRMVAFASIVPRLRHLARQTGRDLGRDASLSVRGELVEIDRKVLDQMSASFEHMIRNSISHGIEDESTRIAAGKEAEGRLRINLEQDGNDILIEFSDDGRGVDRAAIETKARQRGILPLDQELSDDDLMGILATPGLSTASQLTQVSGRGVGMDVVSEMVRQLGGSIGVHSVEGKGTTFRMRLPVTLAISHALLVYAGEQMFAIPARLIFNVLRVPVSDLMPGNRDADAMMYYNDKRIPVLNLANRMGLPFVDKNERNASIIVVRAGVREIGIRVESVSDTREVVVKPLSRLLENIPGFASVTLLGDGSIVLIVDVGDLWQNRHLSVQTDSYRAAASESGTRTVMVVDDSLTVRNVMGRDLQNNGYEVILAKDGVDAMEQLRHAIPDILLVDLEMPRMDGFELTRRVRADSNLEQIPILIITSRSGSRHRDQAVDNGASGYMTKPYRLDELVSNINSLITDPGPVSLAGDPTLQVELNS